MHTVPTGLNKIQVTKTAQNLLTLETLVYT